MWTLSELREVLLNYLTLLEAEGELESKDREEARIRHDSYAGPQYWGTWYKIMVPDLKKRQQQSYRRNTSLPTIRLPYLIGCLGVRSALALSGPYATAQSRSGSLKAII